MEIANNAGYRSTGVYMLHKKGKKVELVSLSYDIDDHGSPSKYFKFPEFSPLYWDYGKMRRVGGAPSSYWHSNADEWLPVHVDPSYRPEWYGVRGVPYYGVYGDYILLSSIKKETKGATKVSKVTKRVVPPLSVIYIDPHAPYLKEFPFIVALTEKYQGKEFYGDTLFWD